MQTLQKHYFHYSKSQWRTWAKAWRNSFKQAKFPVKSSATEANAHIQRHLHQWIASRFSDTSSIGVYLPNSLEVDIAPLVATLLQEGYSLFAPCVAKNRTLEWRQLYSLPHEHSHAWQQNQYGIWEPSIQQPLLNTTLACVLIPALMMDRSGIRLGYGGGYYDVQLQRWQAQQGRCPLSLGVVYDECVIQSLPREAWDVSLNGWVSEEGLTILNDLLKEKPSRASLRGRGQCR